MHHRLATLAEILPLRAVILRQGMTLTQSLFPNDEHPTTHHFATESDQQIIACLTMMQSPLGNTSAWQLRGMSVAPTHRSAGTGRALLTFACNTILSLHPATVFWCNARTPAIGFYQKLGWKIISKEFDIPTAGPHFKMSKLP